MKKNRNQGGRRDKPSSFYTKKGNRIIFGNRGALKKDVKYVVILSPFFYYYYSYDVENGL
jgi:hypothetical protein